MKKTLILLCLILLIGCIVPVFAAAETNEQRICEMAKDYEKVKDAKCIIYAKTCVIALKTEGFVTKSDYKKFCNELTEAVKTEFEEIDRVFFSRNPRVMQQIGILSELPEDKRAEEIQKLIQKMLDSHEDKPIMPRKIGN